MVFCHQGGRAYSFHPHLSVSPLLQGDDGPAALADDQAHHALRDVHHGVRGAFWGDCGWHVAVVRGFLVLGGQRKQGQGETQEEGETGGGGGERSF